MTNPSTPRGKSGNTNSKTGRNGATTWILLLVLGMFGGGIVYWAVQNTTPVPREPGSVYVAAPENAPAASPAAPAAAPHDHSDPAHTHAEAAPPSPDVIPSYFASAEAARPYPRTVAPSNFWNPVVVRAYAVAQEIPGVLAQQPCYCFCYRMGHRGLLDCFASEHGSVCSVCIQEALLADQMTKQGRSAAQIREAIIRGDWREVALN